MEVYKPLEDSALATDLPCHSGTESRSSSTWPRSQTFALHDVSKDEPRLQRRSAIRKHHSHPRETTATLSILSSVKLTNGRSYTDSSSISSAEFLSTDGDDATSSVTSRKSESRSELYVTYREHQTLQRHASADLLQCGMENNTETDRTSLRRSASDPCILESIESESDVFCDFESHLTPENTPTRVRRSSQTATTYL